MSDINEYAQLAEGSIHVDLRYPRTEGKPQYVEVGLEDVRAADSIRIRYDFSRDGWSIEQGSHCDKSMPGVVLGPFDWKEVAFIEAWGREADPARVKITPVSEGSSAVDITYEPLPEPFPWKESELYCLGVDTAAPGTDHAAIGVFNPKGLLKLGIKTTQHLGFTIKKEDFDALLDEFGSGGICACDGALDNGCPLCSREQFQRWYGERINGRHAMDNALERGKKVHEELERQVCAGLQVPREYLYGHPLHVFEEDEKRKGLELLGSVIKRMRPSLQQLVGKPAHVAGSVVVAASVPEYIGRIPPIEESHARIKALRDEGITTWCSPLDYVGLSTGAGGRLMFGCRSEETARAFAIRDKVLYGLSPLGHASDPDIHWYTGTAEELKRVGIDKPIDPSTSEPVREITYCSLAGNGKFIGGIVIEGYYTHARDALVQIEKLGLMPECPEGTELFTMPARSTDEDVPKEDFDAMWSNKGRLLSEAEVRSLLDGKSVAEFEAEEREQS
jgi:hypothetical protein